MPAQDTLDRKTMAQQYGFALAFMESDPELKKLFSQAVKETWTSDKFQTELRASKWFKKNSASVRNSIMQETADPATYKASVDQMYATVKDTWGKNFGMASMSWKTMYGWAETAHRMGWSEAQLMDQMTKGVSYQKLLKSKSLGGTASEVRTRLNKLSQDYGVNLGDGWRANRLGKVMEGGETIAGIEAKVQALAKNEYAAFADRIEAGETVAEIADPYIQRMANLLEVNPRTLDLRDQHIQAALKQRTQDNKPAAMDLYSFEDRIRKDNRWQYTDNAKKQVGDATSTLLRQFGLTA